MEESVPQMIKNDNFQNDISHAISLVLSNLVAASIDVTAVITKTITMRGLDTSI